MQGLIIENISNLYKIKTEKGIYEANARGKFKKEEITPVVGDKVEIQILDEENKKAVIEEIQQRTTYIKRPKMSNITQLVLVVSSKNPKPDLLLLDKQLAFAEYLGIKPIIVLNKIDLDKKKEFEKYKAEDEDSGLTKAQAKERANIKGVWFEEDYLRSYPFNETACDTIGFALDRDVADIGLEGYYNSTLTGVDGRQYGYINDDSDVEQTIIAAVNGKSIQTSIDIGAQQIDEK